MKKLIRPVAALWTLGVLAGASSLARGADAVTVQQDADTYTLANGVVTAKIDKHSGGLISLVYKDVETLSGGRRAQGFWSHSAAGPRTTDAVTIDPAANGGERAEVSVKGVAGGKPMGAGPGGSAIADIEIRYALARGDAGLYNYSIWTHPADYPFTSVGEARFCAKLNDAVFDWMTVDANRNMKLITAQDWNRGTVMNMKEARLMTTGQYEGQVEHKYDYSANQFETPAWGWSSTTKNVGIWFVNPSVEYLSGGPTKIELSAHRDATFNTGPDHVNDPAPPCLLNYWRSSHYGGSSLVVPEGEAWTKVIGPFLIYCNAGPTPDAMWKDALARSDREAKAWPYDWVNGVDYPHRDQRATVSGRLTLNDPQAPDARLGNLLVGLTHPDYTVEGGRGGSQTVSWPSDAKHYEFWVRGDEQGGFTIPNVRPGTYTLHAIADGVLGEYAQADVKVEPGKPLDLGKLDWKPVRFGRQLWDIGVPNRSAKEFLHGDNYWHWGLYNQYPKDFPNDVNYVIGKSDYHKDWNYVQVPRARDELGKEPGRPTTWTVRFNLPEAPRGKAILRLAICGAGGAAVDVAVNDRAAGTTGRLTYNATINRDAVSGSWTEKDVAFDASMMKAGENTLALSIEGGSVMNGVEYDYVRLELDPSASAANDSAANDAAPRR